MPTVSSTGTQTLLQRFFYKRCAGYYDSTNLRSQGTDLRPMGKKYTADCKGCLVHRTLQRQLVSTVSVQNNSNRDSLSCSPQLATAFDDSSFSPLPNPLADYWVLLNYPVIPYKKKSPVPKYQSKNLNFCRFLKNRSSNSSSYGSDSIILPHLSSIVFEIKTLLTPFTTMTSQLLQVFFL